MTAGWQRALGWASGLAFGATVALGATDAVRTTGGLPGIATGYNAALIEVAASGDRRRVTQEARAALTVLVNERHVLHHNLGIALRDEGRFDEAATELRRALALKPDYGPAREVFGQVLYLARRYPEAAAAFRVALAAQPNDAQAHYNLGLALRLTGDLRGACDEFRATLALRPDHAKARAKLTETQAAVSVRY